MLVANGAAQLFDHMQIEPQVRDVASEFVLVISFALPAFCCYRVLYGYSASMGETKPMMLIALAALALNIVINYALVFGNWGFPRLGGVGLRLGDAVVCLVRPDRHRLVDPAFAGLPQDPAAGAIRSRRSGRRSAACCASACRSA